MRGVDKNAMGKADAMSCHVILAAIVVIKAPRSPVEKNAWRPSGTPKIFSTSVLTDVTRATIKKQSVTHICLFTWK